MILKRVDVEEIVNNVWEGFYEDVQAEIASLADRISKLEEQVKCQKH